MYRPAPGESYNVDLKESDIFNKGEVRVTDDPEIVIEDVTEEEMS